MKENVSGCFFSEHSVEESSDTCKHVEERTVKVSYVAEYSVIDLC